MHPWIALLMFCPALAWGVHAQTPVVIADGRADPSTADLSAWPTQPALQQASAAARAYWSKQDASYEEEFHVLGVADGAFTRPGAAQQAVLYVMSLWPRCCPKTGLAIVEGGELVRNVAFEGIAQDLAAAPDLDGNGLDELIYSGFFGMGGQESGSITLVAFGEDGLTEHGGATIYESACGTGTSDASSMTVRILALPGPTYTVERFTASCEDATWTSTGDPEPVALDAPAGLTYVDLPVR